MCFPRGLNRSLLFPLAKARAVPAAGDPRLVCVDRWAGVREQ